MPDRGKQHTATAIEEERIKVLRQYDVFNPTIHESMQNTVQLIADFFDMPVAAVTLVGRDEFFIKAAVGLEGLAKLEKTNSLCALAIESRDVTVFENVRKEPSLQHNSFLQGENGIGFYAAAPLLVKEGFCIGVVFVADFVERRFTLQDCQRLERFAKTVLYELELLATIQLRTVKLEQRELQLKQAFRLAGIGSWEYDVETRTATWSDELFELYGLEKQDKQEDLIQMYLSLFQPQDLPAVLSKFQHPNEVPDVTEERMTRPDGKQIVVHQLKRNIYNAEGELVKVIGISQDITERTAYEQNLRESEERFKALVQNSSDIVAVLDEEANFNYISLSSEGIIGYTPEELIGHNIFEFLHADDTALLLKEFGEVKKSTNSGVPTLHRFRSKSGDWIWLESKGMNRTGDSHIGGIIINARDVTERIHLEKRLAVERQSYQQALTAAVIRAQETERSQLGRELHDNVNQVLTTVKLYTEMINDGIGDQHDLVQKSQRHLQNCIDEIRSISKRLSAPTLGEISLEDSIKELVESINLTNRIEIVYDSQGISGLHISPELHLAVYRIIQEQLNNIIKYAKASLVNIRLVRKAQELSLHITDNGRGFDPSAKRTGIGITNMRTRAENLSGRFEMTSAEGKGCQLQVFFPLQTRRAVKKG